jgi:hypothetical protein
LRATLGGDIFHPALHHRAPVLARELYRIAVQVDPRVALEGGVEFFNNFVGLSRIVTEHKASSHRKCMLIAVT